MTGSQTCETAEFECWAWAAHSATAPLCAATLTVAEFVSRWLLVEIHQSVLRLSCSQHQCRPEAGLRDWHCARQDAECDNVLLHEHAAAVAALPT